MRLVVFFDLPTVTMEDRRNYRSFRKALIKNGFIMLQESVYCKMLTTPTVEKSVRRLLEKNKPPAGIIQSLVITEKQFANMDYLVGEAEYDIVDSSDKVIIL